MFQKLINFWRAFMEFQKIQKEAYKGKPIDLKAQAYQDISKLNFLDVAVKKVANLACAESTLNVVSDSSLTEPLKGLCKDLERNRFDILSGALGGGDYYAVPSTDSEGEIYHTYLDSSRVRILDGKNGSLKKVACVIDYVQGKNSTSVYYLQRIHELDDNGTLTISYQTVDERGKPASVDLWQDLKGDVVQLVNANHIGIGRYKSPVSSRGLSTIYGVPLNFGCGDIERDLFITLNQIRSEFENGESAVITDPRNVTLDEKTGKMKRIKGVIPVKAMSGQGGKEFDIFNPDFRSSAFYEKYQHQLSDLERQMGLSKGIFTENEALKDGTATAVRRSNADTIAFIDALHAMLDTGNTMTLEADGVFLNIRRELWEYNSDYYDPFADAQEQFNNLILGHNAGAISKSRLTEWLYPAMTEEQIEEELAKAKEESGSQSSIESMLNM